MSRHKHLPLILAALLALPFLCRPALAGPLPVMVSIPPQAYLVERLAGPRAQAWVLVGPGQQPHGYSPTPLQMAQLARARVWFTLGLPFEKILAGKVAGANRLMILSPMDRGIARRKMETHHHHEEGEHHDGKAEKEEAGRLHKGGDKARHREDGELDPHIWLSPANFAKMAANACQELVRLDPAGKSLYRANLAALQKELTALSQKLAKSLAGLAGREILVYHPAFGYLAEEFGLKQRAVEIEGKSPSARQLAELIKTARAHRGKVIFVQPQFPRVSAERLAKSIGGAVVPLDPLAKNYPSNLSAMAKAIKQALAKESKVAR